MCKDDTVYKFKLRVQWESKTHTGDHMKFLLALALLTSVVMAEEGKKEEHKEAAKEVAKTEKVEMKKEDKKAAYKAAKEACLKENKDLKGKELKECIVSKNK